MDLFEILDSVKPYLVEGIQSENDRILKQANDIWANLPTRDVNCITHKIRYWTMNDAETGLINGLTIGAQSAGPIGAFIGAIGGLIGGLANRQPMYKYYTECEKEREKTLLQVTEDLKSEELKKIRQNIHQMH
jgi:hypothetical protein